MTDVGSSLSHRMAFDLAVAQGVASRSSIRLALTVDERAELRRMYDAGYTVEECVEEFTRGESDEPREADPDVIPGRYMTRRDAEDIRNAGRGHLLRIV